VHAHGGHDAGHGDGGHHVIPVKVYVGVIVWLMVLLIVTLGAAAVDLGALNLPIAMLIAVVKAAIVMVFFMHLKYSSKLVILFATIAFLFLAVMFTFTFNDYAARGWQPMPAPVQQQ
jgi:cytochrome c oxidase subunit 4